MTMLNKGLKPVLYDKDKAVSPIIATILLVAITVILASTLYLALGGFFTSTKTSATPSVGISATNTTTAPTSSGYTYTITLSSPSSNSIPYSATDWVVTIGGATYTVNGYTPSTTSPYGTWTYGTLGKASSYYITVTGATSTYVTGGTTLTLTIEYYNSASTPALALATGLLSSVAFDNTGSSGGQMGTTSL